MTKPQIYTGKYPLLLGFSSTGRSVACQFDVEGIAYWVYDDALVENPSVVTEEFIRTHLDQISVLVRSPGVPRDHRVIELCERAGIGVITDMHLAAPSLRGKKIIAVSGTDGKSTVVYFLQQLLAQLGKPVVSCGNNEIPILTAGELIAASEYVVLELSSFMLEYCPPIVVDCLILTNITPDHLERYRDFSSYVQTKKQGFSLLGAHSIYIKNMDDEELLREFPPCANIVTVSANPKNQVTVDCRIHMDEDGIVYDFPGGITKTVRLEGMWSYGDRWNMGMCLSSLQAMGFPIEEIDLSKVQRLPYRLERVLTRKNIAVWNDSKSTTIGALCSAIKSFSSTTVMHLIVGGNTKGQSFSGLQRQLDHFGVKTVYIAGKNATHIQRALGTSNVYVEPDWEKCIQTAWENIKNGEMLLFSPACASEMPFANYQERGAWFNKMITKLDKSLEEIDS